MNMTKSARYLVVFIVLFALIVAALWENASNTCPNGQCQMGSVTGKFSSTFDSRIAPQPTVQEKNVGQRGMILVEFFAGY